MLDDPRGTRRGLVTALGAALLLAPLACSDGGANRGGSWTPRPVTVELIEVKPELLRDVVQLVGQLEAEASVVVQPEIDGVLESIEFAEGQTVEAGTPLFRLRNDEQRAELREAEAELSLHRATYKRTRKLAGSDISSRAQLDRAAAELERERARVERARVELERTIIRAPFDGAMGDLWVAPGARLEPDTDLVQIDAVDRLQLIFSLPEVAIPLAKPGVPLEFGVVSFPGERFQGEVYFLAPTLDPNTRRMLVKAWVPNPDHRLRPGQFASIQAEVGKREGALLVPESALVLDREDQFVWRVRDDQTAERAPVKVGLRASGRAEIVEGLRPGDLVVSAGTNKVRAGSVVKAAAPAAPSDADNAKETADLAPAPGDGS